MKNFIVLPSRPKLCSFSIGGLNVIGLLFNFRGNSFGLSDMVGVSWGNKRKVKCLVLVQENLTMVFDKHACVQCP